MKTGLQHVPGKRQRGVVLVVALILLVAITILAVAGIWSATLDLRMASNNQRQERAFQAAETGIENSIQLARVASLGTSAPGNVNKRYEYRPTGCGAADADSTTALDPAIAAGTSGDEYCYRIRYIGDAAQTAPPVEGFSLGTQVRPYHYETLSAGASDDGRSEHAQGFYIIGPAN
jgi:type IV pilus assembly protein PilX